VILGEMMNVAMLSYHTCPLATLGGKNTGGMNVYVQMLTRRLGRLGVHVDVFTRSQDEHVPHVLHDLGYGNRIVHVPSGPEIPLPKEDLHNHIPTFVNGIHHFVDQKNLQYDLIHSHYWMSGIAALALKEKWKIPVINMFHTLGLMKQRVARTSEEAEGDYRIQGERKVLKESDRIVASTQAELAQLQWLYQADEKKVAIIPPGVDTSHFYPISQDEAKEFIGIPQEHRLFLFVGRIEPLKGIDILIKSIAIIRRKGILDKHCCICLSIIGGDPNVEDENLSDEMSRLQALSEEHGLVDLVTFLGRRDQDALPYYYSAAEAVVMPSHYESFGMVALEAMACGTPVVASEVGGLAFLVQDGITGFHFPAEDPEALSEKLIALIENEDLCKKMSENAVKVAKNYDWEIIAVKIIELYQEVARA
jgi:D-inositol-3-phosphate glycosyltransferase